jgi:Tfp pilus assembly protein PilO
MSTRMKLILAGVVALLVCLIFYFFFVRPRAADLERTNSEIEAAEAQTSSLQAQLSALRALEEEEPRLRAELGEFEELVPKGVDTANFIFQMQDTATAAGVPFIRIDPEDPIVSPEDASLSTVRVSIGAQGGFFALQDFIRRVTELDRAVSLDSIDMVSVEGEEAEERGRIELNMVVRIFFETPEVQAPVTVPGEAPVTTETPAAGTTPVPTDGAATPAPGTEGGGGGGGNNNNSSTGTTTTTDQAG